MRNPFAVALVAAGTLAAPAARAEAPTIPVLVRVIRGSGAMPGPDAVAGKPEIDPRLSDLKRQLRKLSYTRWEEASRQDLQMEFGKTAVVALPDGNTMTLRLETSQKDTVTFMVELSGPHKTSSRLTISKDKKIVHQVLEEKDGAAYFASIRPWP
jgi:hypothetical protein